MSCEAEKPARPVMRYHGGKFGNHGTMADWIISHFPWHRIYTEPFGGAASVLMRKPRCQGEVYNDVYDGIVNVFRVLRSPAQAAELERLIRLTPYSRTEYDATTVDPATIDDPIERARVVIYRSFTGFGSGSSHHAHSTGFRKNADRQGASPARNWMNYPDQIALFTRRLQGVNIENRPATEILVDHDAEDCLHYVDPPYVHATRSVRARNPVYHQEMTDADHQQLAEVLYGLSGAVVLSGYDGPLYDQLYGGWKKVTRSSFADGARPRTECLWLNERATAGADLFAQALIS